VKTEVVTAVCDRRSNRQSQNVEAVTRAVERLEEGEQVALPTETVYGLAADALDPIAVAKIFEAKERPHFDPLIVHLPDRAWLGRVAHIRGENRQLIEKLIGHFWPGPFTIVLPKKSIIPEIVTAGLDTIAVRISAHPVFAEIIRAFGGPLAAPSANRFGRVSPTTAQHVLDEIDGRIPLIIDAGQTLHGIESTIVAVHHDRIDILRRGPITVEQLSKFGKIDLVPPAVKVFAPGQLPTHYAPKTRLRLIENAKSVSPGANQRVGLLAWTGKGASQSANFPRRLGNRRLSKFGAIRYLSERQDLREAAANLFRYLRELDALDLDLIVAERVPEVGLGGAIMDRLQRATHDPSDEQDTPE
jgi:L-threonylcarbamoyladenylate synthase